MSLNGISLGTRGSFYRTIREVNFASYLDQHLLKANPLTEEDFSDTVICNYRSTAALFFIFLFCQNEGDRSVKLKCSSVKEAEDWREALEAESALPVDSSHLSVESPVTEVTIYLLSLVKVPISSVFFYFPIRSYISCTEHLRKNFSIWIKSDFVMNVSRPENPIFLRSTRAADHSIDMLRVVT